jgi:putative copper resistance protein D
MRWHVLLTGVQTGTLSLLAAALGAAAVVVYLLAVRRLATRGRHWSPSATSAFLAGVGTVWLATGSGLAAYDDVNVTLHVVQHILIMMVAAPLIALGQPLTLACQAASRTNQVRCVRLLHLPVMRAVSLPPVGLVAYFGSMYAYFLVPGIYRYSIQHPLVHDASHLTFLAIGYLYWQPLVAGEIGGWRLSFPARILATVAGMPFELFLGLSFLLRAHPLNPATVNPVSALGDTHAAGQVFWILAMLTSGIWTALLAWQWLRRIEGHAWRADRRADVVASESRQAAAFLGLAGVPDGWTVPPWRLAELEKQGLVPEPGTSPPCPR